MVREKTDSKSVVTITGIHHSGIPCNDLDRAVDFYTRVLGMKLLGKNAGVDQVHFFGNFPPDQQAYPAEEAYREYVEDYQRARPGKKPVSNFARLKAGDDDVVLFQRTEPVEIDTLVENGIFHQSFHVSKEDIDRLIELKEQGGSEIRFHIGPVPRGVNGRAMYLWDTEGNYLELEFREA